MLKNFFYFFVNKSFAITEFGIKQYAVSNESIIRNGMKIYYFLFEKLKFINL